MEKLEQILSQCKGPCDISTNNSMQIKDEEITSNWTINPAKHDFINTENIISTYQRNNVSDEILRFLYFRKLANKTEINLHLQHKLNIMGNYNSIILNELVSKQLIHRINIIRKEEKIYRYAFFQLSFAGYIYIQQAEQLPFQQWYDLRKMPGDLILAHSALSIIQYHLIKRTTHIQYNVGNQYIVNGIAKSILGYDNIPILLSETCNFKLGEETITKEYIFLYIRENDFQRRCREIIQLIHSQKEETIIAILESWDLITKMKPVLLAGLSDSKKERLKNFTCCSLKTLTCETLKFDHAFLSLTEDGIKVKSYRLAPGLN